MLLCQVAFAATQSVTGRVIGTMGHVNPACRQAFIQDSAGNQYVFRMALPSSGPDSIMAVLLAAATSQLQVTVVYDPSITTGCGSEPAIQYVTLNTP